MRRAALHRVCDLRSARIRHAEVFPLYLILWVMLLFHSHDFMMYTRPPRLKFYPGVNHGLKGKS